MITGLKNCIRGDSTERIDKKISKGRKTLCAASLGIKTDALSLKASCLIYWTIIILIVTYTVDHWILSDDICKLDKSHRFVVMKLQRFHNRSSVLTSFECLG